MSQYLFTSESVSAGHPDKVADQISDCILDKAILQDKYAKVAIETLIHSGLVILSGELTANANIDYCNLVKETIYEIGYCDKFGFSIDNTSILLNIVPQSLDIRNGINANCNTIHKEQGSGDQGMVFGFAIDETTDFMPAALHFSHLLMYQHKQVRPQYSWLGPDAKAQVTILYDDDNICIDTITLSTQHLDNIKYNTIEQLVHDEIIAKVIPRKWLTKDTKYLINPAGRFVIGGPNADCGLTGRKIVVDTYGGAAPNGGGAFSGKDPSKLDRSAAYIARYIAKNIVASKIARKCLIQIAYAIGIANPVSIHIDTYGTSIIDNQRLEQIILNSFDLTPFGIMTTLDLLEPIYQRTATFGHFGEINKMHNWEKTDKVDEIRSQL